MAGIENTINTSVGRPGEPESRSFCRLYQTLRNPINDFEELSTRFETLRTLVNGHRRIVFKCLCSNEVLSQAKQQELPIEAIIPMNLVAGHDSAIVFLAENYHKSPSQGNDPREFITHRQNGKKPLAKVQKVVENNFALSKNLTENDVEDLFSLWQRFGWSKKEISNFIGKIQKHEKNYWFSGIRDSNSGKLVSASTAEAIEFADIRYIETTEYSTLDGYEEQGLCTASVAGLIAQVLSETCYSNNQDSLTTVITAEFNTSSTSVAIGASAGLIVPKEDGVPQILKYNVGVVDGAPANSVFSDEVDENGISFRFLRDFAVAVLPQENIINLYPQNEAEQIINLYSSK